MDSFPKNLDEARIYLSKVKPWAVIAAIAALIVVGFYSLEGWRYWEAWQGSKEMSSQIERISTKLEKETPKVEKSTKDLELHAQRLEYFEEMFNDADISRLIGSVSKISWDSGIELPSISAGDPTYDEVGNTRYVTQSLNLTAQGEVDNIYLFLSNLQTEFPVLSVPKISITSPGPDATAQIQLIFYLLPEYISGDEAAD